MFFFSFGYAQSFSNGEMEAFTKIYFILKNQPEDDFSIKDLINQYPEISRARYGELLRTAFTGDELKLTDQEARFVKDMQIFKSQKLDKKLKVEKKTCLVQGLAHSIYTEMLHQYKSNHHFQNALKPYFQNYLNK